MSKSVLPADAPQGWSTAGEQINHIKVIHITRKGGNKVRRHNEEDIWQSHVDVALPPVCTIQFCSFVKFCWNILQNTSNLHNGIWNTHPQVNNNNGNAPTKYR